MTKITLSNGEKFVISTDARDIVERMRCREWIAIEDDSRDILIRADSIVSIEEYDKALIKEAYERHNGS